VKVPFQIKSEKNKNKAINMKSDSFGLYFVTSVAELNC
jgi:hypothetical protein